MLPKADLLKGVEHREEMSQILDRAERAIKTWEVVMTDFLSPAVLAECEMVFKGLTEVHLVAWGGYPQAERKRLGIAREEVPLEIENVEVSVLEIAGNFLFDTANHRDFLGSMLGTGIVREKTGDVIVLGERGAQVIVVPELVEFLQMNLTQVRSVPVKTEAIDRGELKVREPKRQEMTTVEASMRLDAIASAGFRVSRSKMVQMIETKDVRVNWKEITQASYTVKPGDLIAIRGKGRLEVKDMAITKKERYRVQMIRWV